MSDRKILKLPHCGVIALPFIHVFVAQCEELLLSDKGMRGV